MQTPATSSSPTVHTRLKRLWRLWQAWRWRWALSLVVAVVFLGGAVWVIAPGAGSSSLAQSVGGSDLSWWKISGGELRQDGLRITPMGRSIVNQDGSDGQMNSPVNLAGSSIAYSDQFVVDAELRDAGTGQASLSFYNSPPIIYDEWRYQPASITVSFTADKILIDLWDGKERSTIDSSIAQVSPKATTSLTIKYDKDKISVVVDGRQLVQMPGRKVFGSNRLWVGADAGVGVGTTGWTLTSFKARTLGRGFVRLMPAPLSSVGREDTMSLRNLAANRPRSTAIGAAVALSPLVSDSGYAKLVAGQFNMLTPENEMKAQFIHPQRSVYAFEEADALVDFAKANDMIVHGHALVFGEANPRWMQDTPPADRQQMMIDHIRTIVGHYKGKVAEWDVVNEPLSDNDSSLRDTIWQQAMGEKLFDEAFATARAADPAAKLYINEYGLEVDGPRWQNFLALVDRLLARGVPIDGIGFQDHVYETADAIGQSVLQGHFQALQDRGLLVRISEIDVLGDDEAFQAEQYRVALAACLAAANCTSYSSWGVTDKYGSNTTLQTYPPDLGLNLLWKEDYLPKPALAALQAELKR